MSIAKRQRHHIQITLTLVNYWSMSMTETSHPDHADIGQLLIDVDSKETETSHPDHADIGQLLIDVDSKGTETSHPDRADIGQRQLLTCRQQSDRDITSRSC